MLQLAVDQNYPGADEFKGIEPAMTCPINVLSKEKYGIYVPIQMVQN